MHDLQKQNEFPELLNRLHQLEFDYIDEDEDEDEDGIDFEPYKHFLSISETQDWFRAWTGNPDADSSKILVFGQDGTGGYAAIWIIKENSSLLEQPIVYFGSEGELGVVAANFSDYLWLLATNHGPYEAVAYPDAIRQPNSTFSDFAQQYATTPQRAITEILYLANATFPDFHQYIDSIVR